MNKVSETDRNIGIGMTFASFALMFAAIVKMLDDVNPFPLLGLSMGLCSTAMWILRRTGTRCFAISLAADAMFGFAESVSTLIGIEPNSIRLFSIILLSVLMSTYGNRKGRG